MEGGEEERERDRGGTEEEVNHFAVVAASPG